MEPIVIDADTNYVVPEIPSAVLLLGGKEYRLSSPEADVWSRIVGLDDDLSAEDTFSFLKSTMSVEDFEEMRGRARDPKDKTLDVFHVIYATSKLGSEYGTVITEHFEKMNGGLAGVNRAERRVAARQPTRAVPARKAAAARRGR